MTDTAKLVLSVDSTQVAKANTALADMEKQGKKTEKATDALTGAMRRLAGPLAAAGIATAIKSAINEMDNLSKTSQKIGVTTEALSKLQWAAKLSDVSIGELQMGMTQLIKSQAEAAAGSLRNAAAFDRLGIKYADASGKLRGADEVMSDVAEAFSQMEDGADKTAIAVDLFGRAGANLIPLLNGGANGLREAADEAERFGLVVGTDAGRAAEKFNDDLTRLKAITDGLALNMASDLLPTLTRLAETVLPAVFTATTASARGFDLMFQAAQGLGEYIARAIGGSALDSLAEVNRELAEAQENLAYLRSKGPDAAPQALAIVEAEIAKLEELRKLYSDLDRFRGRATDDGLRPITVTAQRKSGPLPALKGTGGIDQQLAENDRLMAEIEQRQRDQLDAYESVQRIKFGLMDDEQRALQILTEQYAELDHAVSLGAIAQEEATSIRAELAAELARNQEENREYALDSLYRGLLTEEEYLQQSYDRRREAILESTQATEEEKRDLIARLEEAQAAELAAIDEQRTADRLNQASMYMGALSSLMSSGNSKLFAIGKAAAIAQATIDGYQAVQSALAEVPYPFNIAAAAAMAVQAGVQVANIASTDYAGAYDEGGRIPAGKFGIVGEVGPEIVQGPAFVTSRKDTAALLGEGGSSAPTVNVRSINLFEGQVIEDYIGSDKMEKVFVNHVRRNRGAMRAALGL